MEDNANHLHQLGCTERCSDNLQFEGHGRLLCLQGRVDSESKGEQKTWKALPWDSLAVAYLKRLSRRDFAEFRKELIADSGVMEPQDSRLDSHVKKALKRSPLLQVEGSKVGLV